MIIIILTSYISAPPDTLISAQIDNETTGDNGNSSALEITQQSCDAGVSDTISIMPTSLQMEASALDGRRDVDIELDSPNLALSSNAQQKIGILVTFIRFTGILTLCI